jgi:GntR family transcriptional repressor for pyruvate dehydrogenase complex
MGIAVRQATTVRTRMPEEMSTELLHRIADGRLLPGHPLTERRLMNEFGASRTVVREALGKLQALGAINPRRGVGTTVLMPDAACAFAPAPLLHDGQANQLRELRLAIEAEAAALAAVRRTEADLSLLVAALKSRPLETGAQQDQRFHIAVARAAHNPHYLRLIATFVPGGRGADRQAVEAAQDAATHRREHADIVRAIELRDTAAAVACMRMHLRH